MQAPTSLRQLYNTLSVKIDDCPPGYGVSIFDESGGSFSMELGAHEPNGAYGLKN